MRNVILFPRRSHVRASAGSGRKNASIGTEPPEISLRRFARPKEASFRPAKMLRKCAPEQPAASASASTVISFDDAQRFMGWSDMVADISTRNAKSQPQIFPAGMPPCDNGPLTSAMGKRDAPEPREIYLGDWLRHFEIGPSEAAEIAGCTQSYISNIIGGRKANINALYLLRLSEHLEINVNDFFRPLPTKSQLDSLSKLSPKARAAILTPKRKQG